MKKQIHVIIISFAALIVLTGKSQVLNEQFSSGIPAGWTQNPANSWSVHPSFGISGSACIIAEESGSNTLTASIRTTPLNLSGISSPTVYFKAAITKNNFLPGNIVLQYDQGAGPQFVARWGSSFSLNTTDTIPEDGFDPMPPLDAENVSWHAYSKKITPTSNTVSIILDAEFVNGGYILFDSIIVAGVTSTITVGLEEISSENAVSVFPNPSEGKKATLHAPGFKELMLFNQLGENVPVRCTQKNENTFKLDLSGLSPGIYYLNVRLKDDKLVRKKMSVD